MEKIFTQSALRSCLFLILSLITFSTYADGWTKRPSVYVGNPHRPNTVWQPAYCKNGCWHEGYYIKFLCKPRCGDVHWNCKGGYYEVSRYTVVNPGPESAYPGFAM